MHFYHDKQPRICRKCGSREHLAKDYSAQVVCFNCDLTGHVSKECPNDITCCICRSVDHMAIDCPHSWRRRRRTERTRSSDAESSENNDGHPSDEDSVPSLDDSEDEMETADDASTISGESRGTVIRDVSVPPAEDSLISHDASVCDEVQTSPAPALNDVPAVTSVAANDTCGASNVPTQVLNNICANSSNADEVLAALISYPPVKEKVVDSQGFLVERPPAAPTVARQPPVVTPLSPDGGHDANDTGSVHFSPSESPTPTCSPTVDLTVDDDDEIGDSPSVPDNLALVAALKKKKGTVVQKVGRRGPAKIIDPGPPSRNPTAPQAVRGHRKRCLMMFSRILDGSTFW